MILSVFEHQWLEQADFEHPTDFAWLIDQDFAVMTISRRRGQWQLMARQYIGVIRLPSGDLLEILPKVSEHDAATMPADRRSRCQQIKSARAWVQRMLSEISDFSMGTLRPQSLGQVSEQIERAQLGADSVLPLSDWLYHEFAWLLDQYTPLQHYDSHQFNDRQFNGKLLIHQQLRHNAHLPHRFFIERQDLANNALSNRFIAQAWQQLRHLNMGSAEQSRPMISPLLYRWHHEPILTDQEHSCLRRSYQRAQHELLVAAISLRQRQLGMRLLTLAYWLLAGDEVSLSLGVTVQDHDHGSGRVSAHRDQSPSSLLPRQCVFINMNHAFEAWSGAKVAQLYQNDARYQIGYQPTKPWAFTQEKQVGVTVTPDMVISFEGKATHLAEVKYKRMANISQLQARDVYQIAAYADAYEVEQAWLIYPINCAQAASDHVAWPNSLTFKSAGLRRLQIWLVPLWVESGQLLTQGLPQPPFA